MIRLRSRPAAGLALAACAALCLAAAPARAQAPAKDRAPRKAVLDMAHLAWRLPPDRDIPVAWRKPYGKGSTPANPSTIPRWRACTPRRSSGCCA